MTVRDDPLGEPEIELATGADDDKQEGVNKNDTEHQLEENETTAPETAETSEMKQPSIPLPGTGLTAAAFEQEAGEVEDSEPRFRFPQPFYDPSTMKIMKDPVVGPDGNSCEKPPTGAEIPVVYYPNRALKTIIQREVELASPSLIGSLRRLDDAVWNSWNKLVDRSVIGGDMKPLPESFYCPITSEIMSDPVITPNGHTFERVAIEHWVRANGTNPISRDALQLKKLRRNNNLYMLIQIEKLRMEPVSHPSIRRWKATTADTSRRGELQYDDEETPDAATSSADNMPTTYDEIAAMRRQRRQQASSRSCLILFFFTTLVVMGVIPFGVAVVMLFLVVAFLAFCDDNGSEEEEG